MPQNNEFHTLDFLLFFIAAMIVTIYKSILIYYALPWINSLNLPPWMISYVPFTAIWLVVFFLLSISTYRALHSAEYKAGIIHFSEERKTFILASIDIGFIIFLFHILVWSQDFFNNKDPVSALQSGIIFELAAIYMMVIYFLVDIWAGFMMLLVVAWGLYILAFNYYIIKNNNFDCQSLPNIKFNQNIF